MYTLQLQHNNNFSESLGEFKTLNKAKKEAEILIDKNIFNNDSYLRMDIYEEYKGIRAIKKTYHSTLNLKK
jgi:hypothetical protein